MPYDWLFEVEAVLIRLVPAYSLEMLDNCDIERILPFYLFDYRKALKAKIRAEGTLTSEDDVIVRDGKKYRKTTADKATWADKIF